MDAVEKATDALMQMGVTDYFLRAQRFAQAVLDAIGYDALRAERYRYKTALERIAVSPRRYGDPRSIARAALDRENPQ